MAVKQDKIPMASRNHAARKTRKAKTRAATHTPIVMATTKRKQSNIERKVRQIGWQRFIIGMVACWGAYVFLFQQLPILHRLNLQEASLNQQLRTLNGKNAKLQTEIKNLNQDSYIEQLAREKYGMVKPGDIILSAPDNKQ
jgi:cell division protein FtsB